MLRLAHALFLARFFYRALRAPILSDWGRHEWQTALGESAEEAIARFRADGYLTPATLLEESAERDIQGVWGAADLKRMATARGLKKSGNKSELAKSVISNDYGGVKVEYEALGLLELTNKGREFAKTYEDTLAQHRISALRFLSEANYSGAVAIAISFETSLGFPKGEFQINSNADDMRRIMTAKPSIIAGCSESDLQRLREYVALNGLGLPQRKTKEEMKAPISCTRFDFEVAARMLLFNSNQKRHIDQARAARATHVEILSIDDNQNCSHCKEHSKKRFLLDEVPDLPSATCTSIYGCRCLTVAVIPDSWSHATAEDQALLAQQGISIAAAPK